MMGGGDQGPAPHSVVGRSAQVQRGAGAKHASFPAATAAAGRAATDSGTVGGVGEYNDVMSEGEQLQLKESAAGLKGKRTRVEGR